jgi:hypothetical protein
VVNSTGVPKMGCAGGNLCSYRPFLVQVTPMHRRLFHDKSPPITTDKKIHAWKEKDECTCMSTAVALEFTSWAYYLPVCT